MSIVTPVDMCKYFLSKKLRQLGARDEYARIVQEVDANVKPQEGPSPQEGTTNAIVVDDWLSELKGHFLRTPSSIFRGPVRGPMRPWIGVPRL